MLIEVLIANPLLQPLPFSEGQFEKKPEIRAHVKALAFNPDDYFLDARNGSNKINIEYTGDDWG